MATPDTPIEALMQRWAITRNAVKKRAGQLHVELLRPDHHTCLWPGEALELGERFHDHLQAGRPARHFPELPRDSETKPVSQPVSALVAPPAAAPVSEPVPSLVPQPEQLAALVAALAPPADPLAVPEALARAAAAGHWLTAAELAAAMHVSYSKAAKLEHGEVLRPGFAVERQQDSPRAPLWFRVVVQ